MIRHSSARLPRGRGEFTQPGLLILDEYFVNGLAKARDHCRSVPVVSFPWHWPRLVTCLVLSGFCRILFLVNLYLSPNRLIAFLACLLAPMSLPSYMTELQGDSSSCLRHPVDIVVKVAF